MNRPRVLAILILLLFAWAVVRKLTPRAAAIDSGANTIHEPIAGLPASSPVLNKKVARPDLLIGKPLKESFYQAQPQKWPASSPNIWKRGDYEVLAQTHLETVGISRGGQKFFLLRAQVKPVPCTADKTAAPECLLLPNGQRIEVSSELASRLPLYGTTLGYYKLRANEHKDPSSKK